MTPEEALALYADRTRWTNAYEDPRGPKKFLRAPNDRPDLDGWAIAEEALAALPAVKCQQQSPPWPLIVVIIGSAIIGLLRLTVPGHGLTGWPGAYEAFAHIWVGILIGAAVLCKPYRRMSLTLLGALTTLELIKFLTR
jgi:hypothetical protein